MDEIDFDKLLFEVLRLREEDIQSSHEQIDVTIFSEKGQEDSGGYVFLWDDVLCADKILSALLSAKVAPSALRDALFSILKTWQRMREVRQPLSREEYSVVVSVKSGAGESAEIAKKAGLPSDRVDQILADLSKRKYNGKIAIVEYNNGRWSTPF